MIDFSGEIVSASHKWNVDKSKSLDIPTDNFFHQGQRTVRQIVYYTEQHALAHAAEGVLASGSPSSSR